MSACKSILTSMIPTLLANIASSSFLHSIPSFLQAFFFAIWSAIFPAGQSSIPLPSAHHFLFSSGKTSRIFISYTNTMLTFLPILLCAAASTLATPVLEVRTVTALNQPAFQEAQQRDNTATRAFSSTEIKVYLVVVSDHSPMLTILRLPMGIVSLSMNCPETSAQI